jgi:predicted ferric reductase
MLRTLADRKDERKLQFFYGSWSWDDITFREELETLQTQLNLESFTS